VFVLQPVACCKIVTPPAAVTQCAEPLAGVLETGAPSGAATERVLFGMIGAQLPYLRLDLERFALDAMALTQ
jgi:hypothetical protein